MDSDAKTCHTQAIFDAIRVLRSRHPRLEIGFSVEIGEVADQVICGITNHDGEYNIAIGFGWSADSLWSAKEEAIHEALIFAGVLAPDDTVPDKVTYLPSSVLGFTDTPEHITPLAEGSQLPKVPTATSSGAPSTAQSSPATTTTSSAPEPASAAPPASESANLSPARQNKIWASTTIFGWPNTDVLDEIQRQYGALLTNQLTEEQADAFIDYMSKNAPPSKSS